MPINEIGIIPFLPISYFKTPITNSLVSIAFAIERAGTNKAEVCVVQITKCSCDWTFHESKG